MTSSKRMPGEFKKVLTVKELQVLCNISVTGSINFAL